MKITVTIESNNKTVIRSAVVQVLNMVNSMHEDGLVPTSPTSYKLKACGEKCGSFVVSP